MVKHRKAKIAPHINHTLIMNNLCMLSSDTHLKHESLEQGHFSTSYSIAFSVKKTLTQMTKGLVC